MHGLETAVIYGLVGLAVAVALVARERRAPAGRRVALFLLALAFWPLVGPLLLGEERPRARAPARPAGPRVAALEARLTASLSGLEGTAGGLVAEEVARVRALFGTLAGLEARVAEMDRLLASPAFDAVAADGAIGGLVARGVAQSDPRLESARARRRHVARLGAMRGKAADDLERAVLRLDELGTQLQLVRFAGGAEAEALAMLREVADAVGGLADDLLAGEATVGWTTG